MEISLWEEKAHNIKKPTTTMMQWVLLSGGGMAEAVRTGDSEKQVRGLYS